MAPLTRWISTTVALLAVTSSCVADLLPPAQSLRGVGSEQDVRSLFKQVPDFELPQNNPPLLFHNRSMAEEGERDLLTTVRSLLDFILNTYVCSHAEASVWYTDLVDRLGGNGPYTVFFAWDTEWTRMPFLTKFKDYFFRGHLLAFYEFGVLMESVPPSAIPAVGRTTYTMGGGEVQLTKQSGWPYVNGKRTMAIEPLTNGWFYMMQDMLIPPFMQRSLFQYVASEHSTFKRLVEACNMQGTLQDMSETTGITVFAPTNAAFEKVSPAFSGYLESSGGSTDCWNLVRYHMLNIVAHSINLVTQPTPLVTLHGPSVELNWNGNGLLQVKDARGGVATVTSLNNLAYNGIVHEVDKVLQVKNYGPFNLGAPYNVGSYINQIVPSTTVFGDVNSYQYKAKNFVVSNCPGCHTNGPRIAQRYVLACIYYATHNVANPLTNHVLNNAAPGAWSTKPGWMSSPDECTWYGIECNGDGYVRAIRLRSNNLSGMFPPETVLVAQSLEVLDLTDNNVYNDGFSQNDWLGDLSKLQYLSVSQTGFSDNGIPTGIGRLTELTDLDVSYCLYLGPLQASVFTNLQKVRYLDISGNSYNSAAPSTIGSMANLKFFYAVNTDLTGNLGFITSSQSVEEVWIDDNPQFGGAIPGSIGNMHNLISLSLTDNNLNGQIPWQIGNLPALRQVWLYGNNLSGGIPVQVGQLSQLERFEVFENSVNGGVPSQVCALGLTTLAADCNEISCSCCTCCNNCRVPGDTA